MKKTLFVCNFLILSLAIEAAELVGTGKNGMVVTADSLATAVGVEILKKGGNAVDAAIAVNFAMAVTYP
nr:gamma-glutamyltransferase [bacterium]